MMKLNKDQEKIEILEAKIDKLQKSVTRLEKKLSSHIEFIDRVYEPLRSPISKIKNFFGQNHLMVFFIIKVLVSSLIISLASWLSLKKPALAGFLISLPLISIIAIFFSYNEHRNIEKTIVFAKRILVGIPISLIFFLPFFFSKSLGLSFYPTYLLGIIFLIIGFFVHKFITSFF